MAISDKKTREGNIPKKAEPAKPVAVYSYKDDKPAKTYEIDKQTEDTKPLTAVNFYIMIGAAVAIVVGFLLMLGPGTTVEDGYNPDIFSARRIIVAPTISFLGFVAMGVGIIYRPGAFNITKYFKRSKTSAPAAQESTNESNSL